MKCKKCKSLITMNAKECSDCGEKNELHMSQKKQAGCLIIVIIPIIIFAIVQKTNKNEVPAAAPAIVKQEAAPSLPELYKKLSVLYEQTEQLADPKFFNKIAWSSWNRDLYQVGKMLKKSKAPNAKKKQLRLAYAHCMLIFQGYKDSMNGKGDQELNQAKKLAAQYLKEAQKAISK